MLASEAGDAGSIPAGSTDKKTNILLVFLSVVFSVERICSPLDVSGRSQNPVCFRELHSIPAGSTAESYPQLAMVLRFSLRKINICM